MLSVGLGHPRFLHTDLNLLLQIMTLIIILVSLFYKNKGKVKYHGVIMGIAVSLHILSFAIVMGPIFIQSYEYFSTSLNFAWVQTIWLHAVPGAIALLLGIYLVARWAVRSSEVAACYKRKRVMDLTIVLWVISLIFGVATYALFYF